MAQAKQAKLKQQEARAELIVAAASDCGGHSVEDLDKLALAVVANPRAPKLPAKMKWIGAGISKSTVGICADHVLKVCYGTGGWVGPQGQNELAFWRGASTEVRRLLAPIEAADAKGRWILAGRCIPSGAYDGPKPEVSQAEAIDKMARAGLSDLHGANIGVYVRNGAPHWVCLDYGVAQGADRGGKQLIMGRMAGTAIAVDDRPWLRGPNCFTGKRRSACDCGRCRGVGVGFHKGMGRNQKLPSLALSRVCWTGKPAAECVCPKCAGNRKMRGNVGNLFGHRRPIAPRPAAKAAGKAPAARKINAGVKRLARAVAAVESPVEPGSCQCFACRENRAELEKAAKRERAERMLAKKVERELAELARVKDCPEDDCPNMIACNCATHCLDHCCENDEPEERSYVRES